MKNIKVGKVYDYFDDGKIKPSRKSKVIIKKIIPFNKIDKDTLEKWKVECQQCHWLYKTSTDYFIIGELDLNTRVEKIVFVRTKDDRWFSMGFWAGLLDHDGSLLVKMNEYYNNK